MKEERKITIKNGYVDLENGIICETIGKGDNQQNRMHSINDLASEWDNKPYKITITCNDSTKKSLSEIFSSLNGKKADIVISSVDPDAEVPVHEQDEELENEELENEEEF